MTPTLDLINPYWAALSEWVTEDQVWGGPVIDWIDRQPANRRPTWLRSTRSGRCCCAEVLAAYQGRRVIYIGEGDRR